jgi:hypothetical protein
MRTFSPLLALFLALSAGAAPAKNPLRFEHLPLGNVVRIIAARSGVPVTITAQATSPITGDFSGLSLHDGLEEVAAQAGLEVVALGKTDAAGFLLRLPKGVPASPAPVDSAAQRRAALLKQRAALQRSEADLKADTAP